MKKIEKEIKRELVMKLCDGELQLEKMQLNKLEEVRKNYELWTTYIEEKASKKLV